MHPPCHLLNSNRLKSYMPRKTARKSNRAGSNRRYSRKAGEKVREEMHEMKRGRLRMGRSGKKVTNPKQVVAIGLSKARKEGAKVPKKA
jgi:hypothetical protein